MTTSRRLEELSRELTAAENRYTMALDGAEVGVWQWNTVTDEIIWDSRMLQIYDVNSDEFHNSVEFFKELVHPDDRKIVEDAMTACMKKGDKFDIIFRIKTKLGPYALVRSRAKEQRDSNGRVTTVTGLCFREQLFATTAGAVNLANAGIPLTVPKELGTQKYLLEVTPA